MKNIFLILIIFLLFACKSETKKIKRDWKKIDNEIIKINKYLVKEDKERIESYAKRKNWNLQETSTGLWYEIYEKGVGSKVEDGSLVKINYTVELLDGTICYTSDSLGALTFKVGLSSVESGLHEGIMLLKQGDKAHFVLPPHLAHGYIGDDKKIPVHSIIVYNIELLEVF